MDVQSIDGTPVREKGGIAGLMDEQRWWFAVYTRSHHEKRIAQYYTERQIEHLLPTAWVQRQWSHYRKVTLELPLFPNYIFVHIARRERSRAMEVPGALSLVGQSNVPVPMADGEIESLRASLALKHCEPHSYLPEGTQVRVNKGVLAGKTGVVLRTGNSCRIVLTLPLIRRSFSVELDAVDLDVLA